MTTQRITEVERKFPWDDKLQAKLTRNAKLQSVNEFTDTYYDTSDYTLTLADRWLRQREGQWELKLPMSPRVGGDKDDGTDRYCEITDEIAIRKALELSFDGTFEDALANAGYALFCSLKTRRAKYHTQDGLTLDFDTVTTQNFHYRVAEVELIVKDGADATDAAARIAAFFREYGIPTERVSGKVIEYLRQRNPPHYAALVAAGVVKEK